MAKNTYYVVFENNSANVEENNSPVATTPANAGTTGDKALNAVKKYASLSYAVHIADKVVSNRIGTIELRTGRTEMQQRMEFAYGATKRVVGMGATIATGAMVGGGVGAVVGAIIGVTESLFDIGLRQNEIDIKRRNEDVSIYLNRIRAGAGQDRTGKTR